MNATDAGPHMRTAVSVSLTHAFSEVRVVDTV